MLGSCTRGGCGSCRGRGCADGRGAAGACSGQWLQVIHLDLMLLGQGIITHDRSLSIKTVSNSMLDHQETLNLQTLVVMQVGGNKRRWNAESLQDAGVDEADQVRESRGQLGHAATICRRRGRNDAPWNRHQRRQRSGVHLRAGTHKERESAAVRLRDRARARGLDSRYRD